MADPEKDGLKRLAFSPVLRQTEHFKWLIQRKMD